MTEPVDGAAVALCIPTLNPGRWVDRLVPAIAAQHPRPAHIVVIDSSSTDGSIERFTEVGAEIVRIDRRDFDHGATRNLVFDRVDADLYVFLTQDAIPVGDDAIEQLVDALVSDPMCGVAYGRQLPRPDTSALARAHREFNYPPEPTRRTVDDVASLGIRAAFSSNSFAAYRRSAIEDIGRFPVGTIGHEDRFAAAKLLQHGWAVTYVPTARVEHAHDYPLGEHFRRYFDAGVFQASQPWFEEFLGRPESEGRKLVAHQIDAVRAGGVPFARTRVVARAGVSVLGFRLGRAYRRLPRRVCRECSATPSYWVRSEAG